MNYLSRREFLALSAAGLAILVIGAAPPADDLFPVPGLPLPLWVTATQDLYAVRFGEEPGIGLASWSLTVHGMVRHELHLTLDQVQALPAATRMHTLECIGNPAGGSLIGNANWRGVLLRDVLEQAGVEPGGTRVTIGSVDEYFTSIPLERALHEHALLAYELNGQPLPAEHGFPLRAILPGVYGQKQPKWVTGIKITDQEDLGPWESKGWSREATLQLHSAIKVPRRDVSLPPGDVVVAGIALAGDNGVGAVEISTDDGRTWDATVLTHGPSPFVWTQWGYLWRAPAPGEHTLRVRAIDGQGHRQDQAAPELLSGSFPDGTCEIHSVKVHVGT